MTTGIRTLNVKIEAEDRESLARLHDTLVVHGRAFDIVSRHIFEHIDEKKILDQKIVHSKTYRDCMRIPKMKSQFACKARQAALAAWKAIKSNNPKCWRTLLEEAPTMKGLSMRLDCRIHKMLPNNSLKISVLGGGMEVFRFDPYPRLFEMMSRHVMLDPLVFEREGQFWLAMSFEMPEPLHVPGTCIGVDLGQRRLAVTSEGTIFSSREFLRTKRRIRYLKRQLQTRKLFSHSARTKLKRSRRHERNYSRNEMHHLANAVLSSTDANVIVLEDLSKIKTHTKRQGRKHNSMLSQIPFYTFKTILTYKARALCKRVETVDPAYTSKDDSRGLPRGERRGCRYIGSDGVQLDADHNAACNIAQRWSRMSRHPASSTAPFRGRQTLRAGYVNRPIAGARVLQANDFSRW